MNLKPLLKPLSKLDDIANKLPWAVAVQTGNVYVIGAKVIMTIVGTVVDIVLASYALPKETYELHSPIVKDPYGKDRRSKSAENLKRRTRITIIKGKQKMGLKLTKEETELLKQIE